MTAKQLISFYQVISEVEQVFMMRLPLKVYRIIEAFSWIRPSGFVEQQGILQRECNGQGDYTSKRWRYTRLPGVHVRRAGASAVIPER